MGELPPKLFFRIGEVAGLVGVEPHVLRYWEREFRSIRPTKSAKGQRVYSRKDVENLLRVRDLLYRDGFTIAGAKKKLHRGDSGSAVELELETEEKPASVEVVESATRPVGLASEVVLERTGREPQTDTREPADVRVSVTPRVHEKLVALRSEVEAFLAELSSSTTGAPPPTPQETASAAPLRSTSTTRR